MIFEYPFQGDINAKLKELKKRAAAKGITFRGNTKKGVGYTDIPLPLVGKIRVFDASYTVVGQTIKVVVNKAPSGYNRERIDSELRSFLES